MSHFIRDKFFRIFTKITRKKKIIFSTDRSIYSKYLFIKFFLLEVWKIFILNKMSHEKCQPDKNYIFLRLESIDHGNLTIEIGIRIFPNFPVTSVEK